MRFVIFLGILACALGRTLIPMTDVTAEKLRDMGYDPDGSWYQVKHDESDGDPPKEFDSREKWPGCIHPPMEEGSCLGSWALSAASVLSDRLCIKTAGKTNVQLSAQYLISCDTNDGGCAGKSNYKNVFQYLYSYGTPTEECYPYVSGKDGKNGECKTTCTGKGEMQQYKCGTITFGVTELDVKTEVMAKGPMYCRLDRYRDFDDYKSGIYYKVSEQLMEKDRGVKIIGWGEENHITFWIVTNNWTLNWGENGYFRITIGQSGICTIAISCEAYT